MTSGIVFGETPAVRRAPCEDLEKIETPLTFVFGDNVTVGPCPMEGCPCPKVNSNVTKMIVEGCKNELIIPASKGGNFYAYPVQWTAESDVVWVHIEGDEDHHFITQFLLGSPHYKTVAAKSLNVFNFYLVRGTDGIVFFRVILLKVVGEYSQVFFMDFGNREYVFNQNIFETYNERVKLLAPSAIPITLISENKSALKSSSNINGAFMGGFSRRLNIKITEGASHYLKGELILRKSDMERVNKKLDELNLGDDEEEEIEY